MKGVKGFQKGHGFFGYKNPQEHARKISIAKTGKKRPDMKGKNNPMRRPEILAKHLGENHHAWIKDRTKVKRLQQRDSPDYQRWRRAVKKRDEYRCKLKYFSKCSGRLETHHILNWEEYPLLRHEVSNGITLCHAHHPRTREKEDSLRTHFQLLVVAPR